ncbi:hypothetical protein HGI30_09385 [Paenibacillus albicereus]|uniref:Uncharacterized protein n=1 Tax=Paenibacillus albicereus TaxID=2726185 RepID=A0A6H2GX42_9BACL|nr:hypothetical protein [Paenibacillus albicereus]QJC51736.1 hypothetical protein HGI30_09385 [Paenibacillus albicereus]
MPNFYAQVASDGRVIGRCEYPQPVEHSALVPVSEEQYGQPGLLFARYKGGQLSGTASLLTADKGELSADGVDAVRVRLLVGDWMSRLDESFSGPVQVTVQGQSQAIQAVKGAATFAVTSREPGLLRIATLGLDRNAELYVKAVKPGER